MIYDLQLQQTTHLKHFVNYKKTAKNFPIKMVKANYFSFIMYVFITINLIPQSTKKSLKQLLLCLYQQLTYLLVPWSMTISRDSRWVIIAKSLAINEVTSSSSLHLWLRFLKLQLRTFFLLGISAIRYHKQWKEIQKKI